MEGWRLIFDIPQEIACDICNLLELDDMVKLDSALSWHAIREPLQAIQQSRNPEDYSYYHSSMIPSVVWCLRKSIPIKRLYLSPIEVTLFLSDPKALHGFANVQEIIFTCTHDPRLDDEVWPTETASLFNVLSDRQEICLELSCYQPDILYALFANENVTKKSVIAKNAEHSADFMQDERIFPFLVQIGESVRSVDKTLPIFTLPSHETTFSKLEKLILPWSEPIPWLQWLISRSPKVKKVHISGWENLATLVRGKTVQALEKFPSAN